VVKVAKYPDRLTGLVNGVEMAFAFHDIGVPVVLPLHDSIEQTELGSASLWPLVEHANVTASNVQESHATSLGSALRIISLADVGVPTPWNPFGRVASRIENTTFPWSIRERTQRLVECVRPIAELIFDGPHSFAHGDVAISNCLCLDDGRVLLIDLDQAGWRPKYWDLASGHNNLVLESGNSAAFDAVVEAFGGVDEPMALENSALVKATLTTTFGLTFDPTVERVKAISTRLDQMFAWAEGSKPLDLASWWN
jgi:hypothetical protein